MKITIQPYRKEWKEQFERLRSELEQALEGLHPVIEHIGSTAVEGLPAKPVIDIQVGVKSQDAFSEVVERMGKIDDYIYYEVFNESMPQRRLFLKLNGGVEKYGFKKVFKTLEEIPHEAINDKRLAHVHVWVYGTADWFRHIAFRDYLRTNEGLKNEYAALKLALSERDWESGMEYNQGKDGFIKKVEREAVFWYMQGKQTTQIARRLREVILDGKWIANTNFKDQLENLDWKQATSGIGSLNTIASLTFHIHYYIEGILNVLEGGTLDIRDKYSFDMPPVESQEDWDKLREKLFSDAARFADLVEQMPEEKLQEVFVDEKYGAYQRNIEAMIEHAYYHLGQVVLIRKLVEGKLS